MSRKNNVNPDHYKTAGRDTPDENVPPRRPDAPPAGKKRARPDGAGTKNFIPGAAPVGESEPPARRRGDENAKRR
ncbi:MAG: hypothetical protein ACREJG_04185 [Candidatus Rokuibacteriota bacterium]